MKTPEVCEIKINFKIGTLCQNARDICHILCEAFSSHEERFIKLPISSEGYERIYVTNGLTASEVFYFRRVFPKFPFFVGCLFFT